VTAPPVPQGERDFRGVVFAVGGRRQRDVVAARGMVGAGVPEGGQHRGGAQLVADDLRRAEPVTPREGTVPSLVPIPDQDEMREMVIAAFTTKSRDDLSELAADIAAAQRDNASEAAISGLYKYFRDLQAPAADHAQLNTSLDNTTVALQLVNAQLASLPRQGRIMTARKPDELAYQQIKTLEPGEPYLPERQRTKAPSSP
jgi:hypothetical protein